MEGALVSVATGALKPVVGKLFALLGDEYKRFKGVRDQIRFLTSELATMHAFLLKMSEEEEGGHDPLDQAWMKEVRELSYDMEESIDDFMLHVGDKDAKPDGFIDKIKHSLGKLGKMKTHRRIGKEIEDLKKQIIEVGERNARYRTGGVISKMSNLTIDPRALAIFEHASKLVGIEEPKAEIIKLLTEEQGCGLTPQNLKVVAIVGFGGIGKTTLANQVYQELKVQFQCSAFISVSRTPDMMSILRTILSEVSKQRYVDTEAGSIQHLISKVHDFLIGKRYFIVVDDIWSVGAWEIIQYAFPMMSGGSRIITTSRVKDVAQYCSASFTGCVYNIRPLDMVHSRQLFHRRLFKYEEDFPSHLKDVSDEILRKGNTKYEWEQVKVSIGCALERNPTVEGMMKIISLSYFDLPAHLKTCLLYLSIFPEDAIIQKKGLIWRWIAERFIYNEGRYTLYELGEKCFNELVNRSLIQLVETNYGVVKSCRVHDTILDFIISKSIEENFVTLVSDSNITETQSKVRRLSLQGHKEKNLCEPENLVLCHIRSLHVFGHLGEFPSLDRFMHLRVLDFESGYMLENNHLEGIGRLLQLRYLNLKGTEVSELPQQIGNLLCLEMLDLRGTSVHELPASIVNLKKMVNLLVNNYVKFPDGIAKMQALESHINVHVSRQSINFLQELGQLKNLKTLLLDFEGVSATGHENGATVDMKAIVSSLQNLGTLSIGKNSNFLTEAYLLPPALKKLVVWGSTVTRVPNSVGSLVNLRSLLLWMDHVGEEDFCILGGLPSLLKLNLVIGNCEDSRKIRLIVRGAHGFSCLRIFWYSIWDDEMNLMFTAGSMPKLEEFQTRFDAVKTESFIGGDLDFGVENLTSLTSIRWIASGHGDAVNAARAAMERKLGALRTTRGVNVTGMPYGCAEPQKVCRR
ncbi:disease resistance protein RGA5-like [Lolium rigidum]|uniref:disease resistance protein RGA5-like n=1 Tax=Lolium rigidum TaxID=89674 RepID=UPI001F5E0A42|nr:disease resistance protein RGA5-like [Lolium rigidum]